MRTAPCVAIVVAALVVGCGHAPDGPAAAAAVAAPASVYRLASEQGCAQLTAMLARAGLDRGLEEPGPFTLFAPTDEAFARIPTEDRVRLLGVDGRAPLAALLRAHIVAGALDAAALGRVDVVRTLGGAELPITHANGALMVGAARVQTADLRAKNGIVHVVDAVIMPPPGP